MTLKSPFEINWPLDKHAPIDFLWICSKDECKSIWRLRYAGWCKLFFKFKKQEGYNKCADYQLLWFNKTWFTKVKRMRMHGLIIFDRLQLAWYLLHRLSTCLIIAFPEFRYAWKWLWLCSSISSCFYYHYASKKQDAAI